MHFRANDEVQVYCGLTRILNVRRNRNSTVNVSAHQAYRRQDCAEAILRQWATPKVEEFREALNAYVSRVKVDERHTAREGRIQALWSRIIHPWTPFDREAVLSYSTKDQSEEARKFDQIDLARTELEKCSKQRDWAKPPSGGREVDQLAIDSEGRLVLVELKDASVSSASVYYTPFQLLHYVWEWHDALESVRSQLQDLLDARVALGLTPGPVPRLTGGIRAAVGFGCDIRTEEVKSRYEQVLGVVNRHLPRGVSPMETWALECRPLPVQLAGPQSNV